MRHLSNSTYRSLFLALLLGLGFAQKAEAQKCREGNCLYGWGIYAFADGSVYAGFFVDGGRTGYGFYTYANGDAYNGFWENNKREQYGVYSYASEGSFSSYIGQWDEGVKSGFGYMSYRSGQLKGAFWANDVNNGGHAKTGCVEGDCKDGYGKFVWEDGSWYEGSFMDGLRNGFGTYFYTKGGRYTGYFRKGLREGAGLYFFPTGNIYLGHYENDTRKGKGIKFNKGRLEGSGIWDNNTLLVEQRLSVADLQLLPELAALAEALFPYFGQDQARKDSPRSQPLRDIREDVARLLLTIEQYPDNLRGSKTGQIDHITDYSARFLPAGAQSGLYSERDTAGIAYVAGFGRYEQHEAAWARYLALAADIQQSPAGKWAKSTPSESGGQAGKAHRIVYAAGPGPQQGIRLQLDLRPHPEQGHYELSLSILKAKR